MPAAPPLLPEHIYALTPLGESELRGGATRLSAAQINVLVRMDGVLTLKQITAKLGADDLRAFLDVARELCDRGLLQQVELDPFTAQWNADMTQFSRALGRPAPT